MSLAEKYRPQSLKEIVGQDSAIKLVVEWLKNWKPGEKAMLLSGPTGSGKTAIAEAIANDLGYDLIELNASDLRNKEAIEDTLVYAVGYKSVKLKKGKIILFDEADGISSGDRGGSSAIIEIINKSKFPVILTANDAYSPKLKSVRQHCSIVQLKKIHVLMIEKKLKEVCLKEKIRISAESIKNIAKSAEGDMRAALNDMEAFAEAGGQREKEKNIFDVLRILFKTMSAEKAKEVISQSNKDLDEILWWIEQNIPAEYEKPEEIAKAFEFLSKADLFRARIRRNQNYRFLVYFQELLAAVALAKQKPYYKFTAYRPPDRLLILGRAKAERREAEVVELAQQLHCSKRKVRQEFLPYLKFFKGN